MVVLPSLSPLVLCDRVWPSHARLLHLELGDTEIRRFGRAFAVVPYADDLLPCYVNGRLGAPG